MAGSFGVRAASPWRRDDVVDERRRCCLVHRGDEAARRRRRSIEAIDLDHIRPDLAETASRATAITLDAARRTPSRDAARPASAPRARTSTDLFDPGSFQTSTAPSLIARPAAAAARSGRSHAPSTRRPTALVAGRGRRINGALFDEIARRCVALCLRLHGAGRHSGQHQPREDRTGCSSWRSAGRLPLILVRRGRRRTARRRPTSARRHRPWTPSFTTFAQLSGLVPMNLGASTRAAASPAMHVRWRVAADVIIATERTSTLGMGGPAMIEGGGLGIYTPDEVGPVSVQRAQRRHRHRGQGRGRSRRHVRAAQQYLSYFQGAVKEWPAPTSACCATSSPRTVCASTTCVRSSNNWPTPAPCSNCDATSAPP